MRVGIKWLLSLVFWFCRPVVVLGGSVVVWSFCGFRLVGGTETSRVGAMTFATCVPISAWLMRALPPSIIFNAETSFAPWGNLLLGSIVKKRVLPSKDVGRNGKDHQPHLLINNRPVEGWVEGHFAAELVVVACTTLSSRWVRAAWRIKLMYWSKSWALPGNLCVKTLI